MMANNVADLKAETLNETPGNVEAEVVVETKADTLKNVRTWTLGKTMGDIKHLTTSCLIP